MQGPRKKKSLHKSKDTPNKARNYALKLISYRSRSRRELIQRLRMAGFNEKEITSAISFVEGSGLVNDDTLSTELYQYSVERKSLGRRGIRAYLTERGIGSELVDHILLNHSSATDEKVARNFAEKKQKMLKGYPADVVKRRLWGMLKRRGFSVDVIRKVMNSL